MLFAGGLADHGAGDARRRGAAGSGGGHGVNNHCGASIAENGVSIVAERDVRSDDGGVSSAIGPDDQRKVGNVACRKTAGVIMAGAAVGIEVWASGLEVGPFAFGELVDVERVFTGRKVLYVELDPNTVGSMRQSGGANDLILSVFDVNGEGFSRRGRCRGACDGCGEEQAENCRESFHETSFESTADTGLWPGFESKTTLMGYGRDLM